MEAFFGILILSIVSLFLLYVFGAFDVFNHYFRTARGNIADLVEKGQVEVEARGSGIKSIALALHRLVNKSVIVWIPVGTFFVSRKTSVQNMATTKEATVELHDDEWVSISLSAACANRARDIPGSDDGFDIQRYPNDEELARLIPVLTMANVSPEIEQAAVWIITDNADYNDLGILTGRPRTHQFFSPHGQRLINAYEAAMAMRICDNAGINIKKKAIWRDRDRIIERLYDPDLKEWLLLQSK